MNLRRLVELISRNGMVGESKMPSCLGEVRQWINFGEVAQLLDPTKLVELVGFTWQRPKLGLLQVGSMGHRMNWRRLENTLRMLKLVQIPWGN